MPWTLPQLVAWTPDQVLERLSKVGPGALGLPAHVRYEGVKRTRCARLEPFRS
jgi:hypothetical protein